MSYRVGILLLAAVAFGCGSDSGDDGGDPPIADAGAPGTPDAASNQDQPDAAPTGGGTQGPNQFCEILQDGGPFCIDGLDCCGDKVCRAPDDCQGSSGFLPCTQGSDCPNSKICCEIPVMTFCTKPSACSDYNGTVIP